MASMRQSQVKGFPDDPAPLLQSDVVFPIFYSFSLHHLGLIHLTNIKREDLVEIVRETALQVDYLALTLHWPQDNFLFLTTSDTVSPLQGAINPMIDLCRNLRTLRCQDPQLNVSGLRSLAKLKTLIVAVGETRSLEAELRQGFPSLKSLNVDVSHIDTDEQDRFHQTWHSRIQKLGYFPGLLVVRDQPMREFRQTVPDPLINL